MRTERPHCGATGDDHNEAATNLELDRAATVICAKNLSNATDQTRQRPFLMRMDK